jgi:hypothetical protein
LRTPTSFFRPYLRVFISAIFGAPLPIGRNDAIASFQHGHQGCNDDVDLHATLIYGGPRDPTRFESHRELPFPRVMPTLNPPPFSRGAHRWVLPVSARHISVRRESTVDIGTEDCLRVGSHGGCLGGLSRGMSRGVVLRRESQGGCLGVGEGCCRVGRGVAR